MPYEWTDPELFLTHNGVSVYHTYKGGPGNEVRMSYWFTTDAGDCDVESSGEYIFDVRELPNPPPEIFDRWKESSAPEAELYREQVKYALDRGILPLPLDNCPDEVVVKLPNGHTLRAPAFPRDCEYVRIVDAEGEELVYWDSAEWAEDPMEVMGAIVGAMLSV